nr:lytic transglycosylase domain-containing protein [uncultured Desulfobulbus sp.]
MGNNVAQLSHRLRKVARTGLLVALCLLPGMGRANGVDSHLRKYLDVELSPQQRAAIVPHEHLIRYFSSLSYFRSGYTVNPDFIRALMLAESGGDRFAVSGKKALGLCQLLYPTAREVADEFLARGGRVRYVSGERLRTLQPDDLFDPAINILLTCYLIAKYNQAYDGRLDLVVAAWNAGQGSIRNNQPPRYPETLNLIGKVNGLFIALNR